MLLMMHSMPVSFLYLSSIRAFTLRLPAFSPFRFSSSVRAATSPVTSMTFLRKYTCSPGICLSWSSVIAQKPSSR